ncbi:MAG: nucleotide sugar dehydrogenase [Bifidobacteriaceae bacterium]|jgi:UDPglucose 6-dehydrogenase|nr:nucleotide sugar dehydrogenase [Bifidobacteriaceae bacterium]
MLLSVIGCGYLGAVHAAALAALGHSVVGVDTDRAQVALLAGGEAPFYEPGLDDLLRQGLAAGRLAFSAEPGAAAGAKMHFLCVGTPQAAGGLAADLTALDQAAAALGPQLAPGDVVVGKSTVPVGTARALARRLGGRGAELVWNPEFLREGRGLEDTLRPDRIVYGLAHPPASPGAELLDSVYRPMLDGGAPRLAMSYESAELVKTAANSYLALRLSFINAISDLADAAGADIGQVAAALRLDERIGRRFLNPGLGFGGGCLPKDLRALAARAAELGAADTAALLAQADRINQARPGRLVALARAALGGSLRGRPVAVLGLSFKPLSDDVRGSQSLIAAEALAAAGAVVTATDPRAVEAARSCHPGLAYAGSVRQAVSGAQLVALLTEWEEYARLDPAEVAAWTPARAIVDARGVLDGAAWAGAGFTVHWLGRPPARPAEALA